MQRKSPSIAHLLQIKGKPVNIAASTAPNPSTPQTITLIGQVEPDGTHRLFIICNATHNQKKEIWVSRSLKFASHSCAIGWGFIGSNIASMHRNLQTALAVCMVIYGVSNALKCYKDFAIKYLYHLPSGQSFNQTLTIQL